MGLESAPLSESLSGSLAGLPASLPGQAEPASTGIGATFPVVYTEYEVAEGQKGLFGSTRETVTRVGELSAAALGTNLMALCAGLGDVLPAVPAVGAGFHLDSFEVTVEVAASGEVRLVGSVGAEVRGGLKLVFRRAKVSSDAGGHEAASNVAGNGEGSGGAEGAGASE